MNKPICALDTETTGLNKKTDSIIQLSVVKIDRTTFKEIDARNWYIKPAHAYTISPDAEKVHGITKEFLEKNGVLLKDIANDFLEFTNGCDILTYNGNTFDMQFIDKDLQQIGFQFDMAGRKFYDSFGIEVRLNPRDLSSTYKKYTGQDLEGAHDSLADVRATIAVFGRQLTTNALTLDEINDWNECNLLSPEGSIRYANKPGEPDKIVFNIGKYKDSEFCEIYQKDPQYIDWFGKNVASLYTKKLLNKYVKGKLKNHK